MQIAIEHQIDFAYASPATHAIQHIRATPRNSNSQQLRYWQIMAGRQERPMEFFDCFGNIVLEATQTEPHEATRIRISGLVETTSTDGIVGGQYEPLPLLFYLAETDLTAESDDVLDLASAVRVATSKDPADAMHRLMVEVGNALSYAHDPETGRVTAAEALAETTGDSRAHAHVFIACARALEVPARFVSGYRLAAEDDEAAAERRYCWAEAWVENLGWVGFDPVHQCTPNEDYIRLAGGMDDQATEILRCAYRGGERTVTEDIQISQIQGQQQ